MNSYSHNIGVVAEVFGISLAIKSWNTEKASRMVTPIPIFSPERIYKKKHWIVPCNQNMFVNIKLLISFKYGKNGSLV